MRVSQVFRKNQGVGSSRGFYFSCAGKSGETPLHQMAIDFLRNSPKERLQIIAPIIEKDNETKKSELLVFLNTVEVLLAKENLDTVGNRRKVTALTELLLLKRFLFSRAPSLKMIAEYISLSLPEQKGI